MMENIFFTYANQISLGPSQFIHSNLWSSSKSLNQLLTIATVLFNYPHIYNSLKDPSSLASVQISKTFWTAGAVLLKITFLRRIWFRQSPRIRIVLAEWFAGVLQPHQSTGETTSAARETALLPIISSCPRSGIVRAKLFAWTRARWYWRQRSRAHRWNWVGWFGRWAFWKGGARVIERWYERWR